MKWLILGIGLLFAIVLYHRRAHLSRRRDWGEESA